MQKRVMAEVNIGHEKITVYGHAFPYFPGNLEQPPEQETFEIETIEYKGDDVTDLLWEISEQQEKELRRHCKYPTNDQTLFGYIEEEALQNLQEC